MAVVLREGPAAVGGRRLHEVLTLDSSRFAEQGPREVLVLLEADLGLADGRFGRDALLGGRVPVLAFGRCLCRALARGDLLGRVFLLHDLGEEGLGVNHAVLSAFKLVVARIAVDHGGLGGLRRVFLAGDGLEVVLGLSGGWWLGLCCGGTFFDVYVLCLVLSFCGFCGSTR